MLAYATPRLLLILLLAAPLTACANKDGTFWDNGPKDAPTARTERREGSGSSSSS